MKATRYEAELPDGYRLVHSVNFKSKRTAMRFNLLALCVLALALLISSLFLIGRPLKAFALTGAQFYIGYGVFFVAMLVYLLLHELTHGLCYKLLTGKKLTYGISLSCAYCGVPDIYLYRRYALIAALAPFVVFTLVFIPLLIYTYYLHPMAYLGAAFMLGMHLGGCLGDLYISYLALRTRTPALLIRDTGAEQFFYLPHSV